MNEGELLSQLVEAEKELKTARMRMVEHRNKLWKAEDDLVSAKLKVDRLQDQIKSFRRNNVLMEDEQRNEDIERFRKILPELIKKV